MKLTKENRTTRIVLWSISAAVFITIVTLFGIFDLKISSAIFDNGIRESTKTFTAIVGAIGEVLLTLPAFFAFSALAQKTLNCNRLMFKKTLYWTLIALITTLVLLHTYLGFFIGMESPINKEIIIMFSIFYFIVIVAYQAWFWTKKRNNYLWIEKQFYLGLRAVTYLTISFLMVTAMKFGFGRPRPYQVLDDGYRFYYPFEINFSDERGVSFPSGHTISAMSLFALSIMFLSDKKPAKRYSGNIALAMIVFAVALSRVLWLKHWSTDVITSMGIGALIYNLMNMTYTKRIDQLDYLQALSV